ncbi:hypothetical protein [Paeniglutamicibacter gangotriensis]|uniref:Uncharacterized protein n=1 Tax=Paeniglutamicibacter gangotriensis Lz1y TaxID=1276920 RepID=M7MNB5_9MICC|nr:hypothetical protein [Paeniglutamicibacter gangotriensis]EMQ97832.1 hypothetical protein ADIAG_02775 [Paeniglutamicibacter gangotriensis Lz1y]
MSDKSGTYQSGSLSRGESLEALHSLADDSQTVSNVARNANGVAVSTAELQESATRTFQDTEKLVQEAEADTATAIGAAATAIVAAVEAKTAVHSAEEAVTSAEEAVTSAEEAVTSAEEAVTSAEEAVTSAKEAGNDTTVILTATSAIENASKLKVSAEKKRDDAEAEKVRVEKALEGKKDDARTSRARSQAATSAASAATSAASAATSAASAATSAAASVGALHVAVKEFRSATGAGAEATRTVSELAARTAAAYEDVVEAKAAANRARLAAVKGDLTSAKQAATEAQGINTKAATATVDRHTYEDQSSARADKSKWGVRLFIAGIIGISLGFFARQISEDWLILLSMMITLFVTVATIGISNDFQVLDGAKRDKILPWRLKTRQLWAAISFGALGFTLAVSAPSLPWVGQQHAAEKCHISVDAKEPQIVNVQCVKNQAVRIDLSGSKTGAKDRISPSDWSIDDAAAYVSVDGSSVIEVRTSNDKERCTYISDLSSKSGEAVERCLSKLEDQSP